MVLFITLIPATSMDTMLCVTVLSPGAFSDDMYIQFKK